MSLVFVSDIVRFILQIVVPLLCFGRGALCLSNIGGCKVWCVARLPDFVDTWCFDGAVSRQCQIRILALEVLQKLVFGFPCSVASIFVWASHAAWRFVFYVLQHLPAGKLIFHYGVGLALAT